MWGQSPARSNNGTRSLQNAVGNGGPGHIPLDVAAEVARSVNAGTTGLMPKELAKRQLETARQLMAERAKAKLEESAAEHGNTPETEQAVLDTPVEMPDGTIASLASLEEAGSQDARAPRPGNAPAESARPGNAPAESKPGGRPGGAPLQGAPASGLRPVGDGVYVHGAVPEARVETGAEIDMPDGTRVKGVLVKGLDPAEMLRPERRDAVADFLIEVIDGAQGRVAFETPEAEAAARELLKERVAREKTQAQRQAEQEIVAAGQRLVDGLFGEKSGIRVRTGTREEAEAALRAADGEGRMSKGRSPREDPLESNIRERLKFGKNYDPADSHHLAYSWKEIALYHDMGNGEYAILERLPNTKRGYERLREKIGRTYAGSVRDDIDRVVGLARDLARSHRLRLHDAGRGQEGDVRDAGVASRHEGDGAGEVDRQGEGAGERRLLKNDQGEVQGYYHRGKGEVVLFEGADAWTLAHEIGWHAVRHWAERNSPDLLLKMNRYAARAPLMLKALIKEKYGDFSGDELMDEIGAGRFERAMGERFQKLLAKSPEVRGWWRKVLHALARAWKGMARTVGGNRVDLKKIEKMEPEEAIEALTAQMLEGRRLEGGDAGAGDDAMWARGGVMFSRGDVFRQGAPNGLFKKNQRKGGTSTARRPKPGRSEGVTFHVDVVRAVRQSLESPNMIARVPQEVKGVFNNLLDVVRGIESGQPVLGMGKPVTEANFLNVLFKAGIDQHTQLDVNGQTVLSKKKAGNSSGYRIADGRTTRLSTHQADAKYFIQNKTNGNMSFVIERRGTGKDFHEHPAADVLEIVYNRAALQNNPADMARIVHDITRFIATGEYNDTLGAAKYNYSGSKEFIGAAMEGLLGDADARGDTGARQRIEAAAKRKGITLGEEDRQIIRFSRKKEDGKDNQAIGADMSEPENAKAFRKYLSTREAAPMPERLKDGRPQNALKWFAENMVGRTFEFDMPGIGHREFRVKPGHLFRLVCDTPKEKQASGKNIKKGHVGKAKDAEEARRLIEAGEVATSEIAGWNEKRARSLPLIPEIMESFDAVFREKARPGFLVFVKKFVSKNGHVNTVVMRLNEDGETLGPMSAHMKGITAEWLKGQDLAITNDGKVFTRQENSASSQADVRDNAEGTSLTNAESISQQGGGAQGEIRPQIKKRRDEVYDDVLKAVRAGATRVAAGRSERTDAGWDAGANLYLEREGQAGPSQDGSMTLAYSEALRLYRALAANAHMPKILEKMPWLAGRGRDGRLRLNAAAFGIVDRSDMEAVKAGLKKDGLFLNEDPSWRLHNSHEEVRAMKEMSEQALAEGMEGLAEARIKGKMSGGGRTAVNILAKEIGRIVCELPTTAGAPQSLKDLRKLGLGIAKELGDPKGELGKEAQEAAKWWREQRRKARGDSPRRVISAQL